jgi:acyl-CoA synthetase (AMP-forming)/AMP-acid ligase II
MIVAREETSQLHLSTGVWGRVTLDQVLEKNAATKPDKIAVADFSDRPEWTSGRARQLTYAELDAKVEALAAFFAGLGLAPDSVIGLQMPATTDAVVVFFAALRAGLVVAPMPLAWREAEVIAALTQVGAKAIVTVSEIAGDLTGERLRGVAGELFHIRFVFGAGGSVPDGLIDLDRVFEESESLGSAPNLIRKGNAADHAATISWSLPAGGGAPEPLAKSHNHWIATGLMTLLEARVDQSAVLVVPFALTSIMALGGALLPWLLACGTLVLGLPRSIDGLAETVVEFKATHVMAPQRFARRLADRLEMHRHDAMFLIAGADRPVDTAMPRGLKIVDLSAIGEFALIARKRIDHSQRQPLPIGVVGSPSETDFAPLLVETRVKAVPQRAGDAARGAAATGEATLRGPMVPEFIWGAGGRPQALGHVDDWMASGASVQVVSVQPPMFELRGPSGDSAGQGALAIDLKELDALYQSVDGIGDAAAVPFPDATSARVAAVVVPSPGVPFDADAFSAAIEAARVGVHKMPVQVFTVPSIARSATDRVMRSGMASRLATMHSDASKP